MSDDDKAQHQSEYQSLLALFVNFLKNIHSDSREEALSALMELRADLAIHHAFRGFNIDEQDALQLLKNLSDDTLTQQDKDKRDRLIAAVNNLIDFAVCEEYQVAQKADELYEERQDDSDEEEYYIDFNDPDDVNDYYGICALYNDTYAAVENGDIEYAMGVALQWISYNADEYLTYWTMNDAKVRPWHLALQGYTARRDEFPSWMIPPIEWNCRCFLIPAASADDVWGKGNGLRQVMDKVPVKPPQIGDTFSESVATCGRIFGPSHPYFKVDAKDKEFLHNCVKTIKSKYYAKK